MKNSNKKDGFLNFSLFTNTMAPPAMACIIFLRDRNIMHATTV